MTSDTHPLRPRHPPVYTNLNFCGLTRSSRRRQHHTEAAHQGRVWRFILHHGMRHSQELGAAQIDAFLTHLAVVRQVVVSTQKQANGLHACGLHRPQPNEGADTLYRTAPERGNPPYTPRTRSAANCARQALNCPASSAARSSRIRLR